MKKNIANEVWQLANRRLKKLPTECRKSIVELVKEDVDLCFRNNGYDDPICKSMAKEALEMDEYLLPEKYR